MMIRIVERKFEGDKYWSLAKQIDGTPFSAWRCATTQKHADDDAVKECQRIIDTADHLLKRSADDT